MLNHAEPCWIAKKKKQKKKKKKQQHALGYYTQIVLADRALHAVVPTFAISRHEWLVRWCIAALCSYDM